MTVLSTASIFGNKKKVFKPKNIINLWGAKGSFVDYNSVVEKLVQRVWKTTDNKRAIDFDPKFKGSECDHIIYKSLLVV